MLFKIVVKIGEILFFDKRFFLKKCSFFEKRNWQLKNKKLKINGHEIYGY